MAEDQILTEEADFLQDNEVIPEKNLMYDFGTEFGPEILGILVYGASSALEPHTGVSPEAAGLAAFSLFGMYDALNKTDKGWSGGEIIKRRIRNVVAVAVTTHLAGEAVANPDQVLQTGRDIVDGINTVNMNPDVVEPLKIGTLGTGFTLTAGKLIPGVIKRTGQRLKKSKSFNTALETSQNIKHFIETIGPNLAEAFKASATPKREANE